MIFENIMKQWSKFKSNVNEEKLPDGCEPHPRCNCLSTNVTGYTVKDIQDFLSTFLGNQMPIGFSGGGDGNCGEETKKLIMMYQSSKGIDCDACVGPQTIKKMEADGLKPSSQKGRSGSTSSGRATAMTSGGSTGGSTGGREPLISPGVAGIPMLNSSDMSHVEIAKQEMQKFQNGKIKEWDKRAWEHIAKYWAYINLGWAERGTLGGYYGRNKKNKWHWSAAFIQYCMQNNQAFKELKNGYTIGNHRHYHLPALQNTKKLGKSLDADGPEWVMLSRKQAKAIGYDIQIGDIAMIGKFPKLHGDIVVSLTGGKGRSEGVFKIGGNVSNSCKDSRSRTTYIVTQNPEAKRRYLDSKKA